MESIITLRSIVNADIEDLKTMVIESCNLLGVPGKVTHDTLVKELLFRARIVDLPEDVIYSLLEPCLGDCRRYYENQTDVPVFSFKFDCPRCLDAIMNPKNETDV